MTEQNEQPKTEESFSFQKMTADAKGALLHPKEHFSTMPVSGGMGEPVIKALIYGTVAGVFRLLWSILGFSAMGGSLGFLTGSGMGIMALIGTIIGALIGLFVGGAILLIISSIASGSTDYEANVRVTADMMVLMPVQAVFGFLMFSGFLDTLVSLIINLYALWMLYLALSGVLKGKPDTSRIIAIILAILLLLFSIMGLALHKAVRKMSDNSDKILEQYSNVAEKIAREAGGEEAAKAVHESIQESQAGNNTVVLVLEKVDGSKVEDPQPDVVMKALEEMKNDDDFVILQRNDNEFIQAMKSGNGYIVQYKDADGLHEYADDNGLMDYTGTATCFTSYLNKPAWIIIREQLEWKDAGH